MTTTAVKTEFRTFAEPDETRPGVVDTFRRAVVLHQAPDFGAIAVSAAVVTILVPVAYVYFKHVELTMADLI